MPSQFQPSAADPAVAAALMWIVGAVIDAVPTPLAGALVPLKLIVSELKLPSAPIWILSVAVRLAVPPVNVWSVTSL